jgi:hypothetical protein
MLLSTTFVKQVLPMAAKHLLTPSHPMNRIIIFIFHKLAASFP